MIDKNYNCEHGSFMYCLHEKDIFDTDKLVELCRCIDARAQCDAETEKKLFHIYSQMLRHVICHFDPWDESNIRNLPEDHFEHIEMLERSIGNYIGRDEPDAEVDG